MEILIDVFKELKNWWRYGMNIIKVDISDR